jgi:hypothetical protein
MNDLWCFDLSLESNGRGEGEGESPWFCLTSWTSLLTLLIRENEVFWIMVPPRLCTTPRLMYTKVKSRYSIRIENHSRRMVNQWCQVRKKPRVSRILILLGIKESEKSSWKIRQ